MPSLKAQPDPGQATRHHAKVRPRGALLAPRLPGRMILGAVHLARVRGVPTPQCCLLVALTSR